MELAGKTGMSTHSMTEKYWWSEVWDLCRNWIANMKTKQTKWLNLAFVLQSTQWRHGRCCGMPHRKLKLCKGHRGGSGWWIELFYHAGVWINKQPLKWQGVIEHLHRRSNRLTFWYWGAQSQQTLITHADIITFIVILLCSYLRHAARDSILAVSFNYAS